MTAIDQKTLGKAGGLLAYALDPAAGDDEATSAGKQFVRVARKAGIGVEAVGDWLNSRKSRRDQHREPDPQPANEPPATRRVMPFGKHKFRTLGEIARTDFSYLRWMSQNLDDTDLKEDAAAVMAWWKESRQ